MHHCQGKSKTHTCNYQGLDIFYDIYYDYCGASTTITPGLCMERMTQIAEGCEQDGGSHGGFWNAECGMFAFRPLPVPGVKLFELDGTVNMTAITLDPEPSEPDDAVKTTDFMSDPELSERDNANNKTEFPSDSPELDARITRLECSDNGPKEPVIDAIGCLPYPCEQFGKTPMEKVSSSLTIV